MMEWIDLGNPRPRPEPRRYTPVVWPNGMLIPLSSETGIEDHGGPFINLALQRRTRREFSILSLEMLGALTWITCRSQQLGSNDLGFPVSRRPCPSAGAIHPIHLLVVMPDDDRWYRYHPESHALQEVPSSVGARTVANAMQEVLTAPAATLLILAAEPGKTSAKYDAAASLVWRDAGVMLGFLAMAAQALDLSFCPLGVTGEPWVSQLVDQSGLVGVGAAFVGSTPP
jgi:SagB-type dehydrogenase family enzyme